MEHKWSVIYSILMAKEQRFVDGGVVVLIKAKGFLHHLYEYHLRTKRTTKYTKKGQG